MTGMADHTALALKRFLVVAKCPPDWRLFEQFSGTSEVYAKFESCLRPSFDFLPPHRLQSLSAKERTG